MAKRDKRPAARKPRVDNALLMRSAESLGRMIGSLQRQLDDVTKRLSRDGAAKGSKSTQATSAARKTAARRKATRRA